MGLKGEIDFYEGWKTPNRLAENIYDELGNYNSTFKHRLMNIHQMNWYLKDLKNDTKVLGVIMQETLAEDMKRLFNITVRSHANTNRNETMSKFLSSKARDNLHKHLVADFESLEQLEDMNLLTSEQVQSYKDDHEC